MDVKSKASQWLSGNRDYNEGLLILEQHSDNRTIVDLLRKGASFFNKTLQLKEMRRLEMKETEKVNFLSRKKTDTSVPRELVDYEVRKGELFKEMSFHHARLEQQPSKQERGRLRDHIISLDNEIKSIWHIIDTYKATGRMPEQKEASVQIQELVVDKAELTRELLRVRSHISKLKKNPARADLLKEREARRDEIIKLLGQ